MRRMVIGVPMMLLMSVQVVAAEPAATGAASVESSSEASFGPPAPVKPKRKAPAVPHTDGCRTSLPTEPGEVVVCAERPQGYRIDPDILSAKREKAGRKRLKRPDRMADTSCQLVGPMGCRGVATVDIVAATLAAATMLKKAANGENVGKMFRTTPEPTEYELYLETKQRREAEEEAAIVAEMKAETAAAKAAGGAAAVTP